MAISKNTSPDLPPNARFYAEEGDDPWRFTVAEELNQLMEHAEELDGTNNRAMATLARTMRSVCYRVAEFEEIEWKPKHT